ncbi:MAG: response regulator, partial [Elusimicrobiota bacterium]
MLKILIAEDERIIADDIQTTLRRFGYDAPDIVSSGEEALRSAAAAPPDLVLMDIKLKGKMDGIDTAHQLRERFNIPVVYLTAYANDELIERAKFTRPLGYVVKPFKDRALRATLELAEYRGRLEKQLQESHRWLDATLKCLGEAVAATDARGAITFVNPAAETLTGWKAEEVLGKKLASVFKLLQEASLEDAYENARKSGAAVRLGDALLSSGGKLLSIDAVVAPVRDAKGNHLGMVLVFQDVTERRRSERRTRDLNVELERRVDERTVQLKDATVELVKARDEAVEALKVKAQFLANMSHEIRTPLNAVIGMTELVLNTPLNDGQREGLETVRSSGEALLGVVNSVLDFSKAEAGKLLLEERDFDLRGLVRDLAGVFRQAALAKGLSLEIVCGEDLSVPLRGDSGRLRQVLMNLTGNALKFTERGGIAVRAAKLEETAGHVLVRVAVTDTGIGVQPEARVSLFSPFTQADPSMTRKYGGTGLGLAISKRLVELMGGSVGMESEPDRGSTFWIEVPLAKGTPAPPSALRPAGRRGKNLAVLVAEDNVVNRKVLSAQLEHLGVNADAVANGREALDALERKPYDLVFMDCQMPEMDGYAAAVEIRKKEMSDRGAAPISPPRSQAGADPAPGAIRRSEAGLQDRRADRFPSSPESGTAPRSNRRPGQGAGNPRRRTSIVAMTAHALPG